MANFMPRLSIPDLQPIHKARRRRYAGRKPVPYTYSDAVAEDERRIASLKRAKNSYTSRSAMTGFKMAPKLVRKLKKLRRRLANCKRPPQTPASAVYHFCCREPLLDHLTLLARREEPSFVYGATLIPMNNRIPAEKLSRMQARLEKKRLRNDLDRAGGTKAQGWLVGGLHGEYDPARDEYSPHQHVVFSAGMLPVIERLRKSGKYKLTNIVERDHTNSVAPIRIKPISYDDLRYTLSYVTQSWWPRRDWLPGAEGKPVRGPRMRLPLQRHVEWLLWMDSQKFSDIVLLYHLQVNKVGLVANTPRNLSANQEGA